MKVKDLNIGDHVRFAGYNIIITDIDDSFHKRTITFDILEDGLFHFIIGWSFYVFSDLDEFLPTEPETDEDETDEPETDEDETD